MLTAKEEKKIKALGHKYKMGMIKTSIASIDAINAWTLRYEASMRSVLQKRHKR